MTGAGRADARVRRADAGELDDAARLLHRFNREYDEPAPEPAWIAGRLRRLVEEGDTLVLLAGDGPEGVAVLRLRAGLWSDALEAYLAELYVVGERRGHGLGRALLEAAMAAARAAGADRIELGTSEDDVAARALYEAAGFVHREKPPDGPVMLAYERGL
jgi:ribosomal protein S18 acetylase RimI-like enzyme